MRKTTQTVEIEVEGPNEAGNYRAEARSTLYQDAIQKHIDSAPKVKIIDGYEVSVRDGVYVVRVPGEAAILVSATSKVEAWAEIQRDVDDRDSTFTGAALAVIKYIEEEEK